MQNPGLYGTFAVLSPPIANFVRDEGFGTAEKLIDFVMAPETGAAPKSKQGRYGGLNFSVVVTGATNNNYWMIGGMAPSSSVQIDPWR